MRGFSALRGVELGIADSTNAQIYSKIKPDSYMYYLLFSISKSSTIVNSAALIKISGF
jgi:hypothetical protein